MLNKRGAGALLHVSSMPSPYGVGVFNESVKPINASLSIGRCFPLILWITPTAPTVPPVLLREIISSLIRRGFSIWGS